MKFFTLCWFALFYSFRKVDEQKLLLLLNYLKWWEIKF